MAVSGKTGKTGIEPGRTWRERAGRGVLDPEDPRGDPLATPTDRRWLWRIQGTLSVSAVNGTQRQLAADLYAYLAETCEHHYLHSEGDGDFEPHRQCLWCCEVVFEGEAANKAARVILGMEQEAT
jgi:hypothetical protein